MNIKSAVKILYNLLVRKAPFDAQVIVTRRCNLRCGYCSEFDQTSPLVPREELERRIDALHRLGVVHITFLGGEPLLHPDIAALVRYAHRRSPIVSMTTNGKLLTRRLIEDLNAAGLDHMQISIDAVRTDPQHYIYKALRPLRPKILELKGAATFDVHLAAVLCERSADQVMDLLHEADEMGVPMSLSVVHDDTGRRAITGEPYVSLWQHYRSRNNNFGISMIEGDYSASLLRGEERRWKCRSGSRYLYVDEFGKVQYCAMQRGRLDVPVERYSRKEIRESGRMYKGCERGCSNDCVYRASQIDNDRWDVIRVLLRGYFRDRKNGGSGFPTRTAGGGEHVSDGGEPREAEEVFALQRSRPSLLQRALAAAARFFTEESSAASGNQ